MQPLQSAGHLYRTTTIIAIRTFQVFTWLSQSTWEKKCLQGSGCGSNLILCFPTATKVTWMRLFVFLRTSSMNIQVTWAWRATFLHEHFTYTSNLHQRRTNHKHKCIGSISKTIFSQKFVNYFCMFFNKTYKTIASKIEEKIRYKPKWI